MRKKVKTIATKKAKKKAKTEEKENKFDFGGLPSRDLKKNLGCGI